MSEQTILTQRQKPEILSTEPLVNTNIFRIEQVTLKFSNGELRKYERFEQWPHGIIMVVPMIDSQTILLIREYCVGIEDYALTLPKGRVEPDELPQVAATREMQEEIGYSANRMTLLQSTTNSPSYSSTKMHLFLAEDLYQAPLEGDEPEPIDVIPWKLSKIPELIEREDFHEGRAMAALFLTQHYLANR